MEGNKTDAPAAGLIDALRNEVAGKAVLEVASVLERVVRLRVRHASALEPAVEHLTDALQLTFATARRDGELVDATSSKQCITQVEQCRTS